MCLGTLLGSFDEESDERDVFVLQGKGWKLGVNRQLSSRRPSEAYTAFVGGDNWSISLTHEEYNDFIKLLNNLRYSPHQESLPLEIC